MEQPMACLSRHHSILGSWDPASYSWQKLQNIQVRSLLHLVKVNQEVSHGLLIACDWPIVWLTSWLNLTRCGETGPQYALVWNTIGLRHPLLRLMVLRTHYFDYYAWNTRPQWVVRDRALIISSIPDTAAAFIAVKYRSLCTWPIFVFSLYQLLAAHCYFHCYLSKCLSVS